MMCSGIFGVCIFNFGIVTDQFTLETETILVSCQFKTVKKIVLHVFDHVGIQVFFTINRSTVSATEAASPEIFRINICFRGTIRSGNTEMQSHRAVIGEWHEVYFSRVRHSLITSVIFVVISYKCTGFKIINGLKEHSEWSSPPVFCIFCLNSQVAGWGKRLNHHRTFHERKITWRSGLFHWKIFFEITGFKREIV